MKNIYLLQIMFIFDNIEYHFENVYSNLERARNAGQEWIKEVINKEYKLKSNIKQDNFLDSVERFDFEITEFNPQDVEEKEEEGLNLKEYSKHNKKMEDFIYNSKPTKTIYHFNNYGKLVYYMFEIYYKNLDRNKLEIYGIIMLPTDFEEGAGKKYKVGDIIKIKGKEGKYIIKDIPYKKKNQKYFENFYEVIEPNKSTKNVVNVREEDIENWNGE